MGLDDLGGVGGDIGGLEIGGPVSDIFGGVIGGDTGGAASAIAPDIVQNFAPIAGDVAGGAATSLPSSTGAGEVGDIASKVWGGVKEGWSDVGALAKSTLPLAQVGATGFGIASTIQGQRQLAEQNRMIRRAQGLQERAAVPLTDYGQSQLKAATAGQVPAAVQAQIDLWKQGAKQKARDYLARAGIADSSTAAQWDAWIDQQAEAMKVQALQGESSQGIAALQGAAGAGAGMANTAERQQGGIEQLIFQANSALSRLAGSTA